MCNRCNPSNEIIAKLRAAGFNVINVSALGGNKMTHQAAADAFREKEKADMDAKYAAAHAEIERNLGRLRAMQPLTLRDVLAMLDSQGAPTAAQKASLTADALGANDEPTTFPGDLQVVGDLHVQGDLTVTGNITATGGISFHTQNPEPEVVEGVGAVFAFPGASNNDVQSRILDDNDPLDLGQELHVEDKFLESVLNNVNADGTANVVEMSEPGGPTLRVVGEQAHDDVVEALNAAAEQKDMLLAQYESLLLQAIAGLKAGGGHTALLGAELFNNKSMLDAEFDAG